MCPQIFWITNRCKLLSLPLFSLSNHIISFYFFLPLSFVTFLFASFFCSFSLSFFLVYFFTIFLSFWFLFPFSLFVSLSSLPFSLSLNPLSVVRVVKERIREWEVGMKGGGEKKRLCCTYWIVIVILLLLCYEYEFIFILTLLFNFSWKSITFSLMFDYCLIVIHTWT